MASNVVHLIDDDEDVRRAVSFLLGTAGLAVKVYESADSFLKQDLETLQGCIVSDVRMPGIDGLELLRRLSARGVRVPVVIMTGHADVPMAVAAMKAGASDFIEKPFSDETLLSALRLAVESRPETTSGDRTDATTRLKSLSLREKQVLDGLLAGQANKAIAFDLGLSPRTVEVHRANVMTKMGVSSLSSLVRIALLAESG